MNPDEASEQLTQQLIADGMPPKQAAKQVALIEALIDAKIQDAAPEFLRTRDV